MASYRVILAVPANNTTMAEELQAYCPEITDLRVARVPRPHRPLSKDDLPAYRQRTLEVVEPHIGDGVDLVAYGCTSAGFLAGPEGDTEVVEALTKLVGVPTVSTSPAMGTVLKHYRIRSVDLVSPYLDWKNEVLIGFLNAAGVQVGRFHTFQAPNPAELAKIRPEEIMEKALEVAEGNSEALFIACTQLPTREIIPVLRERLQRPVWSAAQATAWSVLNALEQSGDRLEAQ